MTQISNTNDIYNIKEEMHSGKSLPNFFLTDDEVKPLAGISLSIVAHIVFALVFIVATIIQGLVFPHLPKPELPNRNIEFKLVQNESKPPINKNTKNRSDRDSQAGGKHDPTKIESEPRPSAPQVKKSAPAQAQKPQPKKVEQKPVVKPQPKPQPQKSVVQQTQPVQKPTPVKPTPAKPSVVKPTVKPTVKPVVSPSNVVKPSAPKVVSAPKSPFTVSVPTTQAPVGTTYKPQASQGTTGSSGASAPSAPAPKFSTSGSSGASGSSSGSSGGSYASRGSNGNYGTMGNPSPGNPNGAPGIDAIRQPNWGPYMRNLEQKIKRNWTPPKGDSSKRVVVTFVIGRDGRLLSAKVTKSSGVPLADRAAMSAIELTAPFSPLPPEFRGQSVPIEFTFDYNVINSIMR